MKVYAFRHGETDFNKMQYVQGGGTDTPLNDTGRQQAEKLAERLSDLTFTALFSSDLVRAKQTAEIVNKTLLLDVFYTPLLRETHYGIVEAMRLSDVDARSEFTDIMKAVDDPQNPERHDVHFPEGESRNMSVSRLLRLFKLLYPLGGDLLLSTHGGILRSMLRIYGDFDQQIPNCGILRFNISSGGVPSKFEIVE